jgi:branched-chain amino acid aminotransferase
MFYLNGEYVPSSKAKIHCLDWGFRGYGVYDVCRTVNKIEIFRLDEHIERLYNSLRCTEINLKMTPEEMKQIHIEVMKKNVHFLKKNDDMNIGVYVTPGPMFKEGNPTVWVYARVIKFQKYAKFFKIGTHLTVPSIRHVPSQCMDPKIKHTSRMFMHMADSEARRLESECWALMLDIYGNIAELTNSNLFIVKQETVITPTLRNCLPGTSRKVVLELCEKMKIPVFERDIQLFDVYNADEVFQTATTYGIFPVSRINKRLLWDEIPRPITKRLLSAYSEEMGLDIVEQFLSHLSEFEK